VRIAGANEFDDLRDFHDQRAQQNGITQHFADNEADVHRDDPQTIAMI
jgi:hypothetical protein